MARFPSLKARALLAILCPEEEARRLL